MKILKWLLFPIALTIKILFYPFACIGEFYLKNKISKGLYLKEIMFRIRWHKWSILLFIFWFFADNSNDRIKSCLEIVGPWLLFRICWIVENLYFEKKYKDMGFKFFSDDYREALFKTQNPDLAPKEEEENSQENK